MRKVVLVLTGLVSLCLQQAASQNTSPYWSLAGNSNASTSSKLGTTTAMPLRLITNNIVRVHISSSAGNVGIGTTTPSERLHINSASGKNILRGAVNGSTKLLSHSNGGLTVGSGSTPPANGLYVAGSVGIGTTTASSRLTVSSAIGTSPFQVLVDGVPQLFVGREGGLSVGTNTESPIKGLRVEGKVIIGQSSETDADYPSSLTVASGGIVVHNSAIGLEAFGDFTNGIGVSGRGFVGVYGRSLDGTGVYAEGATIGLEAVGTGNDGIGVKATSSYIGIQSSGPYVGVYGISDNYAGYFEGDVYTSGSYLPSARKLKQNITAMSDAMVLISKLQPKEYEYKQEGAYKLMNLPQGKRYGLIAEEVEEVLPGLVKATEFDTKWAQSQQGNEAQPTPARSEKIDFKALNYTELIPIMIKGIQELDKKTQRITQLERKNQDLEARLQKLEALLGSSSALTLTSAHLEQNTPNPVRGTTAIRYLVPETSASATLVLTNSKAQQIKIIPISSKGAGQVNLNTSMFSSGAYNYTLYVDGKAVDTKQLSIIR